MPDASPPPRLAPGLYGIADAAFGDPVELGVALAHGGAAVVQLRAKGWSTAERIRAGRQLVERLAPSGVRLVMNDDLDAAVACGAHGLHRGQDDGPLAAARARLGPAALLGRSTHSVRQVESVDPEADYIGFGPVFDTHTKAAAGAPRGLARVADAVRCSRVPVVAIGGIRAADLPGLRAVGVRHWAVISDILRSADVAARARAFAPA